MTTIAIKLPTLTSLELKSIITQAENIVKMRKDQRTIWNQAALSKRTG